MKTPELQNVIDSSKEVKASKLRKAVAGVAIVGSLAGAATTYALSRDEGPKDSLKNQEVSDVLDKEKAKLVGALEQPEIGEKFVIANSTFELNPGTTVNDGHGNNSILDEPMTGVQYPAWSPDGKELCFTFSAGKVVCFEVSSNASSIKAIEMTDNGWAEAPVSKFTPENGIEAVVTTVEPDGYAFGKYGSSEGYIAGRPTN